MLRVLGWVVTLALTVYALIDCVQTDQRAVKHLPKPVWLALIVIVPWAGPIAWLLAGRERSVPPRRRSDPGPRGPEDDPDFLRNL